MYFPALLTLTDEKEFIADHHFCNDATYRSCPIERDPEDP
jgi:hypothetical protein